MLDKMAAADPTYPLYPVSCLLSVTMLLLVLLSSSVRRSWNFGLTLLCFWLALAIMQNGINSILWSDNADSKFLVYCDIGTSLAAGVARVS